MRPPICLCCNKSSQRDNVKCSLVYFALTQQEKAFNQQMIDQKMVGHKKGLEWFCEEHITVAKKYSHLTLNEAIKSMRKELNQND